MYVRRKTCILLKMILIVMVLVPVIWTGVWLSHQSTTKCVRYLNKPFLVIGILLLLLSLARLLLYLITRGDDNEIAENYLCFCMLVLFLVLLGYTVFALVATTTTTPTTHGHVDNKHGQYSNLLRDLVIDSFHWRHIKNCFVSETKLCSPFFDVIHNNTYQSFQSISGNFDSLQDGCCTPLKACNTTDEDHNNDRAITWKTKPENDTISSSKQDCQAWNNDPNVLCFNCESCKVEFLHDIKTSWKKTATINIAVIICLAILWWCGDCGHDPEDDYTLF